MSRGWDMRKVLTDLLVDSSEIFLTDDAITVLVHHGEGLNSTVHMSLSTIHVTFSTQYTCTRAWYKCTRTKYTCPHTKHTCTLTNIRTKYTYTCNLNVTRAPQFTHVHDIYIAIVYRTGLLRVH